MQMQSTDNPASNKVERTANSSLLMQPTAGGFERRSAAVDAEVAAATKAQGKAPDLITK